MKTQKEIIVNIHIFNCCTNRENIDLELKYNIFVPGRIRERVPDLYNVAFKNPGASRMYSTIIHNLIWYYQASFK